MNSLCLNLSSLNRWDWVRCIEERQNYCTRVCVCVCACFEAEKGLNWMHRMAATLSFFPSISFARSGSTKTSPSMWVTCKSAWGGHPRQDPPAEHHHFSLLVVRRAVTLLVCVQQITYVRAVFYFLFLYFLSCCSLTDPQMAVCDSQFELKVLVITVQSAA